MGERKELAVRCHCMVEEEVGLVAQNLIDDEENEIAFAKKSDLFKTLRKFASGKSTYLEKNTRRSKQISFHLQFS